MLNTKSSNQTCNEGKPKYYMLRGAPHSKRCNRFGRRGDDQQPQRWEKLAPAPLRQVVEMGAQS